MHYTALSFYSKLTHICQYFITPKNKQYQKILVKYRYERYNDISFITLKEYIYASIIFYLRIFLCRISMFKRSNRRRTPDK